MKVDSAQVWYYIIDTLQLLFLALDERWHLVKFNSPLNQSDLIFEQINDFVIVLSRERVTKTNIDFHRDKK